MASTPELDHTQAPERRTRSRFGRSRSIRPLLREGTPTAVVAHRERVGRRSLAVADAIAAAIALGAVIQWSGGSPLWALPLAVPVILATNKIAGLYDRDDLLLNKTTLDEAPQLLQICGLFALVVWLLYEPVTPYVLGSWQVLTMWLGSAGLILGGRMLARRVARRIGGLQRCLVVGDSHAVTTLARKLDDSDVDAEVVTVLPVPPGALADDLIVAVRSALRRDQIDRVIVAPRSTDASEMLEVIRVAKLEGVRVTVLPRLFEVVGSSVEFDQVDGLTMLGVRRFGLTRSSRLVKRAFDLAGSTVLLAAAAPLMALMALAIRLDTPGPVLFRQRRVGRDGTYFEMFKFRSMVADADGRKAELLHLNETEGLFKIAADPRITRVGRILRRTSLDELPQLFNVWRGEMSLVGPRPLVVDEDEKVQGLDRARLHLTPGMTGPWQVLGSTRVPMSEMVVIDYLYAANWSLWSDMKILLRTIPHMLSGRGR